MLTLSIKKKWFDMILSGEKKEEYRNLSSYYWTRFMNIWEYPASWHKPHQIKFRNGYRKDSPSFIATCTLNIGYGKEEWGAKQGVKYYILTIKSIEAEEGEIYDKLKPCPFCGSEIDFSNAYEDESGEFIPANIYCPGCGVIMTGGCKKLKYDDKGHLIGGWLTEEELNKYDNDLVEKWNRRYASKPHGRLIDADAVKSEIIHKLGIRDETKLLPAERTIYEIINYAPTVIGAEGQDNECG